MKCKFCAKDLAKEKSFVVILGVLACKECAVEQYEEDTLHRYGEEIPTESIDIAPECDWCHEEHDKLIPTNLGMLCRKCISAIRSRGETVWER